METHTSTQRGDTWSAWFEVQAMGVDAVQCGVGGRVVGKGGSEHKGWAVMEWIVG